VEVNKKRNNIITWFLVLIILASILTWLISFLREVEKKETNIDRLSSGLYVVRMLIPESAEITFFTNMDEAHETELLYQSQYVLAPRLVLKDKPAPYILLIEDPSILGKKIENDRQICSVHKNNLVYTLLKRKD
jgi:predicted nucleic acid-binding Zn ribbon protein